MKITVFGATGATGQHVLEQARAAGHQVTAVVRDPSKVRGTDLTVVEADTMDPAAIEPAVAGADAVISALGTRNGRGPTTVCTDGATSIVRAMTAAGTRRLVVVSAAGLAKDNDDPFTRVLVKPIVQRMLRHPFADMTRMEALVRASDLDWTIIRPPMLTEGPRGAYRTEVDTGVRSGMRISRANLAHAILLATPDERTVGKVLTVAR
ncbi:NAD(P)-dependent oxidoreductase [Amycolatopsis sp. 195334CR]|uniref:NAD(P)-dependent oxidoreductase n=1 Tax=Amycolatopsis sp. 195334CR TaxID=2814588 RepID=UPI001A8CE5E4|nr:SDR family oxidoreductase [Amycolatopsis sp. 195334CR]MBN6034703.1 SDR family oxidoreductase [Amycolatopsis sp. 195334CR]